MANNLRNGFARLFMGTEIKDTKRDEEKKIINKQILVAVENDEAADLIDTSNFYHNGYMADHGLQAQVERINEYRTMSNHAEVDRAVDDIINEAVTSDADEQVIDIAFDATFDLGDEIKASIEKEFRGVVRMLNFEERAYEIFRQWYVDGRLYYHKIIDPKSPSKGILKLVNLDPRAIKRIKEVQTETDADTRIQKVANSRSYFLYDPTYMNLMANTDGVTNRQMAPGSVQQALELSEDSVAFVHSGVIAGETSHQVLSHLEKARKPLNNLRMLEDAVVIYRITRAPERRIFYVDVGSLPKKGAEEYVNSLMSKYNSRMVYDGATGTVKGNSHQVSMMQDYWLPRREGGKGTEISTLEGGQNLDQIADLMYFQKRLYIALNVPQSRLENEATISIGNRMAEITRDEWKFNKFVQRLRRRFNGLFRDLLRSQLILKGITTSDDWDEYIKDKITFEYASDSFVKEQQEAEALEARIAILTEIDPFVGKYFSLETVKKQVLRQDEAEIVAEQARMDKEVQEGRYFSPIESDQLDAGIHPDQMEQEMDLKKVQSKKPAK